MSRVGGKKRRAWRLKKKYHKWFDQALLEVITDTLAEMPQGCWENAFTGDSNEN